MSGRLYLDEIYSKSGQTKVLDTTSFDANNNFEASNTGFNLNYQSANAALNVVQSGTGDALRVNSNSLVVNASGNVGIGTNNPNELLTLRSSDGVIRLDTTRSGTTYNNSSVVFSSPRSGTADNSTVAGRGLLSCLGNSGSTAGIVWLQAASASLGSQETDTELKTNQCGIRLASNGSLEHWSLNNLRMSIDSNGRVTTPYQPHIFGTPGLGTVGANGKADRFYVQTSRGNLTASSGVITVPVDGVYAITFTTITQNLENARRDNWIYVNNVYVSGGLNETDTTGYKHRSLAISIFIYEGDYIEFGSTSWYATGNSFDYWQTASVTLLG